MFPLPAHVQYVSHMKNVHMDTYTHTVYVLYIYLHTHPHMYILYIYTVMLNDIFHLGLLCQDG